MIVLTASELCTCGHAALAHGGDDYTGGCCAYNDIGLRKDGKRRVSECRCRAFAPASSIPNTEDEAA